MVLIDHKEKERYLEHFPPLQNLEIFYSNDLIKPPPDSSFFFFFIFPMNCDTMHLFRCATFTCTD